MSSVVVDLEPGGEWAYEPPEGGHANLVFASASSPDDAAVEVWLNDERADKVYLRVPHSWWMPSQAFAGQGSYAPGDRLLVRAVGGRVAFRIDLDEHRPGA